MPVLDVQIIMPDGETPDGRLAAQIADASGAVFGTPAGRTWVTVSAVPRHRYAENGGGPPPGVLPVFVSVLKAASPDGEALAAEACSLAERIGVACGRPTENVHVLYLPPAAGRIAFGGQLVE